jgi:predicted permease
MALSAIGFGLAPAIRVRRMRLHDALKTGRTITSDRRGQRVRATLVITEIALALTLVLSASLLLRSFATLAAFNPGFPLERLLTFQVYPPMSRYDSPERRADFYTRASQAVAAIPGVLSVGTASSAPLLGGGDGLTPFLVNGRPPVPVQDAPLVEWYDAGPGFFPTLGVPIVQGRNLSENDRPGTTTTALVNQTMAARHWPDGSAVGARLSLPQWDTEVEIVGVVPDLVAFRSKAAEPAVYVSNLQRPRGASFFVVRTTENPTAIAADVRAALTRLDPDVEPYYLTSMEELLRAQLVAPRFSLLLIAFFATVALILCTAGLYAVIAYTVAARTREFGIRMALGAQPADVLRGVLADGGRLLATGVLLGLLGAFYFTRLMRGLIEGVTTTDPLAVILSVLILSLVGAAALLAPAMRAGRTDPVTVLREE